MTVVGGGSVLVDVIGTSSVVVVITISSFEAVKVIRYYLILASMHGFYVQVVSL